MTHPLALASPLVVAGFILLPVAVAAGFVAGCGWAGRRRGDSRETSSRRMLHVGLVVAAWMSLTLLLAASGVLQQFHLTPPPFAGLVLTVAIVGVALPFSRLGEVLARHLPLSALVGFQMFRLPLELVMHEASEQGVMPVQMSYSGLNFDIATGITAGALAGWLMLGRVPRWIVAAWNLMGFGLLCAIITIAILSTPTFRLFGDDQLNTFVTFPPFVWLPAILVLAALMGHVLIWRRLAMMRREAPTGTGGRLAAAAAAMAGVLTSLVAAPSLAQTTPSPELLEATRWYTGVTGRVDDERARELLREADAKGDVLARMWVARCLSRGRMGMRRDETAAKSMAASVIVEVKRSADAGVLEAVFLMGTAYDEALGVTEDPAVAAEWFHRAADRGHVLAQHNLGNAHAAGRGVEQSDRLAVAWWLKAARQGDAIPQLRLGEAYEHGRGVAQDAGQARRWYADAASRGNAAAAAALKRLGG